MQCKYCNGTGTSNICVNGTFKPCSFCDGTGEYEPFDLDVELDKLDNEPITNEEWFCTLSTEEKAKWFCDHITCSDGCRFYGKCFNEHMGRELWEEWLKQPH